MIDFDNLNAVYHDQMDRTGRFWNMYNTVVDGIGGHLQNQIDEAYDYHRAQMAHEDTIIRHQFQSRPTASGQPRTGPTASAGATHTTFTGAALSHTVSAASARMPLARPS
ncbi:hypothetical protein [Planomonospora venezuelensis]|uniref:Uncharacterized protein n=1 Tax=Planomonospora venezuelensis TaxID=1999 RepID=A0A841CZX0_PLAVE|nr:hypothetical protein [Planomonospora venezuelensis]MBB5960856.1 hypothetical protein [Planomonospora venezuelensis]GIN01089.1 hypothetical protein Pve01_27470 [Planomonospora venezuelensis]